MEPLLKATVSDAPTRIFVDPWSAEYGSPNQIDDSDDDDGIAELIESEGFGFVAPPSTDLILPIAFVDGRRRAEALLSQWSSGSAIPGLAGAFAVGAVLVQPGGVPEFARERIRRLVIWSAGAKGSLPPVAGGWAWETSATAETGPSVALRKLQETMRDAEADLAKALAGEGYLVVTDGTLWFATGDRSDRIAGYVKTHHRRLLPLAQSELLFHLPARQRTTIFSTGRRYSCYLRLTEPAAFHAPLSGLIRLEFSNSIPLADVRTMADQLSARLPAYAGILHVDPRAPQNLQPVGALEHRLSHLFGHPGLAARAVREAVVLLRKSV